MTSAGHTCHWPGCPVEVPPKLWGCKRHWFALPKLIRNRIWATYRPGQEITKTPSPAYLAAARAADNWIAAHAATAPPAEPAPATRSHGTPVRPSQEASELLDAALGYAARGWPVFPCRPGRKEPATTHGFENATVDPAQIRRWWAQRPNANVAIATGAPGPDVLDVDTGDGKPGWDTLERLRRAGLVDGPMMQIRTPRGGLHLYYTGTEAGNHSRRRHGIDTRAKGGYVVAPPSRCNGTAYVLLETRPPTGARLDWDRIARVLDPPHTTTNNSRRSAQGTTALAAFVQRLAPGERNNGLFWAACRAVEAGADDEGLESLIAAAAQTGLSETEARRTVASAQRNRRSAAHDR